MTRLLVLGNVNVDLVLGPVDGWPAIGSEVEVERAEMRAGGSAGNTALALSGLGVPHLMVASTGDDPNGMWLRNAFDPACCEWIDDPGMTTMTVGIVHNGGDRAFFTTPGHLQRASPDALMARVPQAAGAGAIAVVSGGFLMPAIRDATAEILGRLKSRGWASAIDPGCPPQGWNPVTRGLLRSWLPLTDHVLINEDELAGFSGGAGHCVVMEAMRDGATLVVKRGAGGAAALRGSEQISCAAPQVAVIDTVGAGDSFNAAYLAAIVSGEGLSAALRRGVEVASRAVSTYPRRYSA